MSSKRKKDKRRRVLAASCLLAALIVAGSTFAWFTSQDEVVNKLSATNNYGVTAVEDFTPPSNWIPGQTVDKDVRVTNTGNVDAFVKTTVTGDLVLTRLIDSQALPTDAEEKAAVLASAIELSTSFTEQANPDTPAASKDQVRAKQAGSRLVYSADINHTLVEYDETNLQKDDTGITLTDADNNTFITVDEGNTDDYKPTETGYYIFARSTTENADGTAKTITYDGYYYDDTAKKYYDIEVTTPFAKKDEDGNEIVGSVDPYKIVAKLRQKQTVTIANDQFVYTLTDKILTAKYDPDYDPTDDTATPPIDDGNEIIINIALADNTDWTAHVTEPASLVDSTDTTGKAAAFYYNKILAAGTTTKDVIDSVTLDSRVTKDAFLALDYNLKVTVQSAQVTKDYNNSSDPTAAVNVQDWTNTEKGALKVTAATYSDTENSVTWDVPAPTNP